MPFEGKAGFKFDSTPTQRPAILSLPPFLQVEKHITSSAVISFCFIPTSFGLSVSLHSVFSRQTKHTNQGRKRKVTIQHGEKEKGE
jgi:hypothetical protein